MKADQTPHRANDTQERVLLWVEDKIERFNAGELHNIPVLYLQGGVGSGKSRAVLAPVIEMLTQIPNMRILWGRQDLKDLKLSIMDKFFEILPSELLAKKSEQYHWYDIRQVTSGTKATFGRLYFNGLKDLAGFGSQEFGAIAITETHETTENGYRTLKRRCRQEGVPNMILMEGEPPNEDHWLTKLTDPTHDDYDPDIEKWEISTYENWDNLPLAYRGSLETMPEAWKRKYLLGKTGFIPDGKAFYEGFKCALHSGEFEWNKHKPLYIGWDFGFHHPAVIVTQLDQQDRWIWLRELVGSEITIQKFIPQVNNMINTYYPNAETIHFGDPACLQVNDKSETTSYKILLEHGIQVGLKQSSYRERKEIFEMKLGSLINGKPMLMVDSRYCRTATEGFLGGYHYPERKPNQQYNDKKFEVPYRDGYYEHIMNAGEYIAVNLFSAVTHGKRKRHGPKKRIIVRDNI